MRIGLDISSAVYGTGVSHYTTNLVRSMLPLLHPDDQMVVFGASLRQRSALHEFSKELFVNHASAIINRLFPFPPSLTSLLFNQLNLPINRLTGDLDLFHAWDWYIPHPGHAKLVSTVHDLALFKFPDTAHPQIKTQHQAALIRLKQFNAHLIAVSQATKNDVIKLFNYDPALIHVIPEALPQESCLSPNDSQIKTVLAKYHLNRPYMLMVGTHEPRKNFLNQIKAWEAYKHDYDLVLVGKQAWQDIKPQSGLHLLGYVAGLELASLYRRATALLYVSLYEGFGLPILEAFYHQVPVVTGNVSAMPEVSGDAAVLTDPHDKEAIAAAIGQALQFREALVSKGTQQLAHYSWQSTAHQTLDLYKEIIHES
jgi:O-antigen biosynthesis alpha-1,3-mannosyltransferase